MSQKISQTAPAKRRVLSPVFDWLAGGVPDCDAATRDRVLSAFLRWRFALTSGLLCTMSLWFAAVLLTGDLWPIGFAAIDMMLASVRLLLIRRARTGERAQRRRRIEWLMLLGTVWAFMLGCGVMVCILVHDARLLPLAICLAAGTVGVVTFRNAPAPRQGSVVILAITMPGAIAAIASVDPTLRLFGLLLLPWSLSLMAVLRQNYFVLLENAEVNLQLHRAARTDPLTGVANRLRFNERMHEFDRPPASEPLAILCLDLDGFKAVNDRHGHEAGDRLLREVSDRLRNAIRNGDEVFRLGGDEFAVILSGMRVSDLDTVAAQVIAALREPFTISGGAEFIGASIGSAERSPALQTVQALLRAADAALYIAKAQGRGVHVRERDSLSNAA